MIPPLEAPEASIESSDGDDEDDNTMDMEAPLGSVVGGDLANQLLATPKGLGAVSRLGALAEGDDGLDGEESATDLDVSGGVPLDGVAASPNRPRDGGPKFFQMSSNDDLGTSA